MKSVATAAPATDRRHARDSCSPRQHKVHTPFQAVYSKVPLPKFLLLRQNYYYYFN